MRLLLGIAWAVAVLPGLPVRELMPPDEPRFGQVASEMRAGGHWIVPHLADRVYGDKPPVLFWAVNLASAPAGRVRETTARIPSALAALAVVLLTARLARRLTGSPEAALGSGLVVLTTVEFLQRAQWLSTDMLLAAFSLAAAVAWSEALFGAAAGPPSPVVPNPATGAPPARERNNGLSAAALLTLGWLAVTAAVMTKGPIALFWAVAWPVAEGLSRGEAGRLRRLLHPTGITLFVAIAGGWLLAAERVSGGGYIREVLVHQSVQRYVDSWNNQQPWHFYLHQFPLDLAPWSLFLPAGLVAVFASRQSHPRTRMLGRAVTGFLLAGGLLLSFTAGKRGVYLLPAFPAAAILIATGYLQPAPAGEGRTLHRLLRQIPLFLLSALGLLVGGVGLYLLLQPGAEFLLFGEGGEASLVRSAVPLLLLLGGALALGAGAALRYVRRSPIASLVSLATSMTIVSMIAGTMGGSVWTRSQGAAPFGREIASRVPASDTLAIERGKFELILFYSGRKGFQFEKTAALTRAAASGEARYAIVQEPMWQELIGEGSAAGWITIWQGSISTTHYRLLRVAAASPSS